MYTKKCHLDFLEGQLMLSFKSSKEDPRFLFLFLLNSQLVECSWSFIHHAATFFIHYILLLCLKDKEYIKEILLVTDG